MPEPWLKAVEVHTEVVLDLKLPKTGQMPRSSTDQGLDITDHAMLCILASFRRSMLRLTVQDDSHVCLNDAEVMYGSRLGVIPGWHDESDSVEGHDQAVAFGCSLIPSAGKHSRLLSIY